MNRENSSSFITAPPLVASSRLYSAFVTSPLTSNCVRALDGMVSHTSRLARNRSTRWSSSFSAGSGVAMKGTVSKMGRSNWTSEPSTFCRRVSPPDNGPICAWVDFTNSRFVTLAVGSIIL